MKTDTTPNTRLILTPEQAGKLLECSTEAATRLMETGKLVSVDFGRKGKKYLRTSAAHIEAFKAGSRLTVGSLHSGPAGPEPASPVRGLIYAGIGRPQKVA